MSAVDDERGDAHGSRGVTLLKLLGAVVLSGLLAAATLIPVVGGIGLAARSVANEFLDVRCDVTLAPTQQTTTILAPDGKTVIASLFDQNRRDVPLSAVPRSVRQALLSAEDRRFYQHHGVDLR